MNINPQSWMSAIDDSTNLFTLTIPGAHDCATQHVQFPYLAKCQDLSIAELLCSGVRALDVRVEPSEDRLRLVHGISKVFATSNHLGHQMDLEQVLDDCYHFLEENPSETIIFQFKNDNNRAMEKCFDNLFYTYIKGNEDKWYCENRIPSLSETRGRLVLVRRCDIDISNSDFSLGNTGIDFSCWIEQDAVTPEPLRLGTGSEAGDVFIIQDRYKYKPQQRWDECLMPFLDSADKFNGEYIINYTSTAGGTAGPKGNAEIINSLLMEYELRSDAYYGIIYLDFAHTELAMKLIEHNFR